MKSIILALIVVVYYFLPAQAAVTTILGAAVDEPQYEILCSPPSFCARIIAPDWTNANRFFGTDGSNCRVSENKGRTWTNCASNPSTTIYLHYAVTQNGYVVSAGNDNGGTELRIRRSTNKAVTWSTVYSAAPVDLLPYSNNGRLRCSQTSAVCTFIYINGTTPHELISTDEGATWSLDPSGAIGAVATTSGHTAFANSSTLGMYGPNASDGVSNNRSLVWNGAGWTRTSIWPTTAGGQCNWTYINNGLNRAICHVGSLGTQYETREQDGTILNTFTLPGVPSDNGGNSIGLAISRFPGEVWVLRNDSVGNTGIWFSNDDGNTYEKRYTIYPPAEGMGNQGSIFQGIDNCWYASYLRAASNSTVIRVCY